MPYSAVHFELGLSFRNKFQDYNEFLDFLAGSIFVDVSYILNTYSINISRAKTHFYEEGEFENADFDRTFQKDHTECSAFLTWYFVHLVVDKVWRDSPFVRKVYFDEELESLYQFSRKIYASKDIAHISERESVQKVIKDLYSYKVERLKLPFLFHDLDETMLQKAFIELLDYMFGKKIFYKKIESKNAYKISKGAVRIKDTKMKSQLKKFFPYKEYAKLKKTWFEKMKNFLWAKLNPNNLWKSF